MELCKYKDNEVSYFDCDAISCFDQEKEAFFFGGNTILRIYSIHHCINPWKNYKYYIEGIQNIIKIINGLKIEKKSMTKKGKETMKQILKYKLPQNNYYISNLTDYIEKLINHHISEIPSQINFYFYELMNEYAWLKELIVKDKKNNLLNISNLCNLFN